MEFIKNTKEERDICYNSSTRTRENSKKINYLNKINDKPWGKEYLVYQNKYIGIWILHVNKEQETSLHCHFKKDTILMPILGCFKINLFENYKILNVLEYIYVPRNTFHGIHSYVNNGILMEIEVYTDCIEYTDKNDLLRIKDIYNRDKNNYETSVVEREPCKNETMVFEHPNTYNIDSTEIKILKIQNINEIRENSDIVIILDGCMFSDGKKISSGSFIDLNKEYSILTQYLEVLCISNIYINEIKKIIYF